MTDFWDQFRGDEPNTRDTAAPSEPAPAQPSAPATGDFWDQFRSDQPLSTAGGRNYAAYTGGDYEQARNYNAPSEPMFQEDRATRAGYTPFQNNAPAYQLPGEIGSADYQLPSTEGVPQEGAAQIAGNVLGALGGLSDYIPGVKGAKQAAGDIAGAGLEGLRQVQVIPRAIGGASELSRQMMEATPAQTAYYQKLYSGESVTDAEKQAAQAEQQQKGYPTLSGEQVKESFGEKALQNWEQNTPALVQIATGFIDPSNVALGVPFKALGYARNVRAARTVETALKDAGLADDAERFASTFKVMDKSSSEAARVVDAYKSYVVPSALTDAQITEQAASAAKLYAQKAEPFAMGDKVRNALGGNIPIRDIIRDPLGKLKSMLPTAATPSALADQMATRASGVVDYVREYAKATGNDAKWIGETMAKIVADPASVPELGPIVNSRAGVEARVLMSKWNPKQIANMTSAASTGGDALTTMRAALHSSASRLYPAPAMNPVQKLMAFYKDKASIPFMGLNPGYAARNYSTNIADGLLKEGIVTLPGRTYGAALQEMSEAGVVASNKALQGLGAGEGVGQQLPQAYQKAGIATTMAPQALTGGGKWYRSMSDLSSTLESRSSLVYWWEGFKRTTRELTQRGRMLPAEVSPTLAKGLTPGEQGKLWDILESSKSYQQARARLDEWIPADPLAIFETPKAGHAELTALRGASDDVARRVEQVAEQYGKAGQEYKFKSAMARVKRQVENEARVAASHANDTPAERKAYETLVGKAAEKSPPLTPQEVGGMERRHLQASIATETPMQAGAKPYTAEQIAKMQAPAPSPYKVGDVRKAASDKGIATITEKGAPNDRQLLNVLNKHKEAGAEAFTRGNLDARAEEAVRILDNYTPSAKPAAKAAKVAPVAPKVETPTPAPTTAPDWVRQEIDRNYANAERLGLVDKIEELSAQRKTAKEVARELNVSQQGTYGSFDAQDMVRSVRSKLGIPSMDDKVEFEKWLVGRKAKAPPVAAPAATPKPPPVAPAPKVEAAKQAATPKQPWEMTKAEYVGARRASEEKAIANLDELMGKARKQGIARQEEVSGKAYRRYMSGDDKRFFEDKWREIEKNHKRVVEQAIADGKPVPPEVLKEYPDLAKTAAQAPKAAKRTAKGKAAPAGAGTWAPDDVPVPHVRYILDAQTKETLSKIDAYRDAVLGNFGKDSVPVGDKRTLIDGWLNEWQAPRQYAQANTIASSVGDATRNFILHDYTGGRLNLDTMISYLAPWNFWYTREGWTYAQTFMRNPAALSAYAAYRDELDKATAELPASYKEQVQLLPEPYRIYANVANWFVPFEPHMRAARNVTGQGYNANAPENERLAQTAFDFMGMAPGLEWVLNTTNAQVGPLQFKPGLNEQTGKIGIQTMPARLVKNATAFAKEANVPFAASIPPGGVNLENPVTSALSGGRLTSQDPFEIGRVSDVLVAMRDKGEITQAEYGDAMTRQSGDVWDKAANRSAANQLLPEATSALGFRMRQMPEATMDIDAAKRAQENLYNYINATNPSKEELGALWDNFYQQYPAYREYQQRYKPEETRVQSQQTERKYTALDEHQAEFEHRKAALDAEKWALPIGTPTPETLQKQYDRLYQWDKSERAAIDAENPNAKPANAPQGAEAETRAKEDAIRNVLASEPKYGDGAEWKGDYNAYSQAHKEWERNIPQAAEQYTRQVAQAGGAQAVSGAVTAEDVQAYRQRNDTAADALSNAFREWKNERTGAIARETGKQAIPGYEKVARAEMERTYGDKPTEADLLANVKRLYGDKFTPDELKAQIAQGGIAGLAELQAAKQTPEEKATSAIYDALGMRPASVSGDYARDAINAEAKKLGLKLTDPYQEFYDNGGKGFKPNDLALYQKAVENVAKQGKWQKLGAEDLLKEARDQETFGKMKAEIDAATKGLTGKEKALAQKRIEERYGRQLYTDRLQPEGDALISRGYDELAKVPPGKSDKYWDAVASEAGKVLKAQAEAQGEKWFGLTAQSIKDIWYNTDPKTLGDKLAPIIEAMEKASKTLGLENPGVDVLTEWAQAEKEIAEYSAMTDKNEKRAYWKEHPLLAKYYSSDNKSAPTQGAYAGGGGYGGGGRGGGGYAPRTPYTPRGNPRYNTPQINWDDFAPYMSALDAYWKAGDALDDKTKAALQSLYKKYGLGAKTFEEWLQLLYRQRYPLTRTNYKTGYAVNTGQLRI